MKFALKCASLFLLAACATSSKKPATSCTYETWDWDTRLKKSVHHVQIKKLKSELVSQEISSENPSCTVCEEDQSEISLPNLPKVKVCSALKDKFEAALKQAVSEGFKINSLVGYRVGKSKGALDANGLRTEFSNHSFGTAIDINSELNGLYDFCFRFGPDCRLLRGGQYREQAPGAITKDASIYRLMRAQGFQWGGEMNGKQKDFMHFSISGM